MVEASRPASLLLFHSDHRFLQLLCLCIVYFIIDNIIFQTLAGFDNLSVHATSLSSQFNISKVYNYFVGRQGSLRPGARDVLSSAIIL